jgi:hypothetical protein
MMTLENLLRIGRLREHPVDHAEIQRLLDALRRKRNLSDYMGQGIDEGSVKRCRQEAEQLLRDVVGWLEGRPRSR